MLVPALLSRHQLSYLPPCTPGFRFGMLTDAAVFPARIGPLGSAFVKCERLEDEQHGQQLEKGGREGGIALKSEDGQRVPCMPGKQVGQQAAGSLCAKGNAAGRNCMPRRLKRRVKRQETARVCSCTCRQPRRDDRPAEVPSFCCSLQVVPSLSGSKQLKMRYKPANDGPTGREDPSDPGKGGWQHDAAALARRLHRHSRDAMGFLFTHAMPCHAMPCQE